MKLVKIRSYERGLFYRDREFRKLLEPGRYFFVDPFYKIKIEAVSLRDPWLIRPDLDLVIASGALEGMAEVIDLKDHERALVWIDGRFERILMPGLYAVWTTHRKVRIEVIDATGVTFTHPDMQTIANSCHADAAFNKVTVQEGFVGLYFKEGVHIKTLVPGEYLFWKHMGKVTCYHVDMKESVLDVSGQEIMTRDKVTLRLNAIVTFLVKDALKSISAVDDSRQALYREAQLALRSVIGSFELDTLLGTKEDLATDLVKAVQHRARAFGMEILSFGIRDIILPGEMKALMNKVIEAKKAADANLIMRREETAAMRSQVNTARLLENNPTLMRLKELDLLEKIAGNANMKVVLGEKGLAEKVMNFL